MTFASNGIGGGKLSMMLYENVSDVEQPKTFVFVTVVVFSPGLRNVLRGYLPVSVLCNASGPNVQPVCPSSTQTSVNCTGLPTIPTASGACSRDAVPSIGCSP